MQSAVLPPCCHAHSNIKIVILRRLYRHPTFLMSGCLKSLTVQWQNSGLRCKWCEHMCCCFLILENSLSDTANRNREHLGCRHQTVLHWITSSPKNFNQACYSKCMQAADTGFINNHPTAFVDGAWKCVFPGVRSETHMLLMCECTPTSQMIETDERRTCCVNNWSRWK